MRVTAGDLIVVLAAAFLAWGALDQRHRKRFERDAAREAAQFRADYQAGLAARQPLEALIEATRDHDCGCRFEPGPGDPPCTFVPCEPHRREQEDWDLWADEYEKRDAP